MPVFTKAVAPTTLYHPSEKIVEDPPKNDDQSKLAVQVLESTLSSASKKKFKRRQEERYDMNDHELYNVWVKLNTLTLDGGKVTQDLETTSKSLWQLNPPKI